MRCFGFVVAVMLASAVAPGGEIADIFQKHVGDRPQAHNKSRDFAEEVMATDHGITEIGLERTACYGTCPVYWVIIDKDGNFRYEGQQHVKRSGKLTGKVDPWRLNQLCQFIRDAGYLDFEDSYSANVSDSPTAFTTVVIRGKRKVIRNYADTGPTSLWAIEQLIDRLLLEATWDGEADPSASETAGPATEETAAEEEHAPTPAEPPTDPVADTPQEQPTPENPPTETVRPEPGSPESIEQVQPSFFVRADVNRPHRHYYEGDQLTISAVSEVDAYLYVLYKQADGKVYLIFPNAAQPENRVKARLQVNVPSSDDTFRWVVQPPFGRETVKVIASRTPLKELADPAFRRQRFNQVSEETVKGIRMELVEQEVTTWAEDTIEVKILPRAEPPVATTPPAQPEVTPPPAKPPVARRPRRFGVFFGVAEYEFNNETVAYFRRQNPDAKPEELHKLNVACPDNNARLLNQLLRRAGGLEDSRVYVNSAATKENLKQAVTQWLPSVSRPGDTVVIFFCGHGDRISDDNGDEADQRDEFLLTHDIMGLPALDELLRKQQMGTLDRRLNERVAAAVAVARKSGSPLAAHEALCRATGVTDDLFGHWLQRLAGRQVLVILETCHSGGFAAQEKSLVAQDDDSSFDFLGQELSRLKDIGQPETALLTAASKDQVAWAFSPQRGISVLTYYLKDSMERTRGRLTIEQAHQHCRNGIRQFSVEVNRYKRQHGIPIMEPQDPLLFNHSARPVLLKP